jgi:hypothetical protein
MLGLALCALALAEPARAQDSQAAKLANPIASLISVPLQYNQDRYGGAHDSAAGQPAEHPTGDSVFANQDWNLITRTIVPLIDQRDFPVAARKESGLGHTTASLFFSPKAPTAGGWIWGAGPVLSLSTAPRMCSAPRSGVSARPAWR